MKTDYLTRNLLLSVLNGYSFYNGEPPANQPPANEPPANQPPANQPPANEPPANQPNPSSKVTFTAEQQAHLNSILAEERRKGQERVKALETRLQESGMTAEQLAETRNELEALQATFRTKEQQQEHERQQAQAAHQAEIARLKQEGETWQKRYSDSTISRELTDAASSFEAFNNETVVELLRPRTAMEEAIDENGKKTGKLVPIVTMEFPDKDGKMQTFRLSPKEAVKRMTTETARFGNLFKSNLPNGLNQGGNADPTSPTSVANMSPAEYIEKRRKGEL